MFHIKGFPKRQQRLNESSPRTKEKSISDKKASQTSCCINGRQTKSTLNFFKEIFAESAPAPDATKTIIFFKKENSFIAEAKKSKFFG